MMVEDQMKTNKRTAILQSNSWYERKKEERKFSIAEIISYSEAFRGL